MRKERTIQERADDKIFSFAEPVMGTVASFTIYRDNSGNDTRHHHRQEILSILASACAILHQADGIFSTWKLDSPLSRYRRGEVSLEDIPVQVSEVLDLCHIAKDISDGWFDPWAIPGGVDPTGLVKGWAVERALAELVGSGITGAMLNVGGDLAMSGRPGAEQHWRIGIRHPWIPDALACVLETDVAVATSGTYERGNILIDPHSGLAECRAASATVVGPSLALADALATALAVAGDIGIEWFRSLAGYEAYLIRTNGTEIATDGIKFATEIPHDRHGNSVRAPSAGKIVRVST